MLCLDSFQFSFKQLLIIFFGLTSVSAFWLFHTDAVSHRLKRFQSHLSQLTKAQSNDNNLGSEFDRHVSGSFAASNVDYDEDVVGPELWPHLIKTLTPRSDRGCAVKALQTALKEICRFQDVRVDGYYGIITLNAVLEFQRNHAANLIDVDGVVGNLTWLHLLGDQSSDD